jgi:hypothetical protein
MQWFNAVDAAYRSDVRAIADAQSARSDAQMGRMRVDAKLEQLKAELLRWMFLFWIGTVGALLAMTKL